MLVSELIKELVNFMAEHGDMEARKEDLNHGAVEISSVARIDDPWCHVDETLKGPMAVL